MLIEAVAKAFRNLLLPGILKLFLLCLLAYAVGWSVLAGGLGWGIAALSGAQGAESMFMHMLGAMGGWVLAWFLFPLLYPVLVSFFDDYMADAIERQDYPLLPPAKPPFWPTFGHDLLFSLKALGLNILLIPFYLVPLVGIAVYYALNGWLLGTQFFRMAAGRRASASAAEALRKKAAGSIFIGGVLISFCATVPLLNLAAPLLGVATMLHLFHAANGTPKAEVM